MDIQRFEIDDLIFVPLHLQRAPCIRSSVDKHPAGIASTTLKPDVYWVHFTGSNVKNILRSYGIPLDEPVINTGVASAYQHLFSEMIHELQTCRIGYQEMLEMYLRQLLLTIQRYREERTPSISIYLQESIDAARRYFNEHYNEETNIEQYAESIHMSTCWFARNFKKVAGCAPLQ